MKSGIMDWEEKYINKVTCGDCLELMKNLPDESVDLVITDPPFFVLKQNKKLEKAEWDKFENIDDFMDFTAKWMGECYRILKEDSQMYLSWSQMWMKHFWNLQQSFMIKRMLIWNNPCKTKGFTSKMYLWNYTPIFFLIKGKPKIFNAEFLKSENVDVFRFPAPQTNYKKDKQYHFLQKPLELIKILTKNSSKEMDIILDPFGGSGTIAVAAEELHRQWIVFEFNPEYCQIAEARIAKARKQIQLNLREG